MGIYFNNSDRIKQQNIQNLCLYCSKGKGGWGNQLNQAFAVFKPKFETLMDVLNVKNTLKYIQLNIEVYF